MKPESSIKWLWSACEGFRGRILLNGVAGVMHVGASLCFVWITKHLVDVATGESEGSLPAFALLAVSCVLLQLVFSVFTARTGARTEIRMRSNMRYRLFSHIMSSCWTGKEAIRYGDMLSRFENDVLAVTGLLSVTVPSLMATCVQLAGAICFIAVLDARLAAIVTIIMPLALMASKIYIRRMRRLSREIREQDSLVQSHILENIQHRTLMSALEYSTRSVDELAGLQAELETKVMDKTDYSMFSRLMVQAGFSTGFLAALLWGVCGLNSGTLTFGVVAAFLQLVSQVQRPFVELGRHIPAFIRVMTSAERLDEIMRIPLEKQGEPVRLSGIPGIRMEDVTFSYPDDGHAVVNGFSHDFKPGSMTAIVGETGAGKSTIVRLMLALLRPDRGSITIYDNEKSIAASPMTRCNMVYVPQGNTLVSGTIRDNLLLGKPSASDEELAEAIHAAVADFVYSLPNGLDAVCGELGAGLSEGQAQRIAIARGLLRQGGIMILDEPASSLDPETEKTLMERLSSMVHDRTLIIISHRESVSLLCTESVRIFRN